MHVVTGNEFAFIAPDTLACLGLLCGWTSHRDQRMHNGLLCLAVGHNFHIRVSFKRERQVLELQEFLASTQVEFAAGHALCSAFASVKIDQGVNLGAVVAGPVFKGALAGLHADDMDALCEFHGLLSVVIRLDQ